MASAAVAVVGCSDLTQQADATVDIAAADSNQATQLRQDLLQRAPSWGGVRVGEDTSEQRGDISLTFSLPGRNLDAALGAIHALDADIESQSIDVERGDVERTTTSQAGTPSADDDGQVTLEVNIGSQPDAAGAGALLRLVMAVFSIIGMVSTVLWIGRAWKRRFGTEDAPRPRRRNIDVDISDPPTQETPQVPRGPWN